jgi:predicted SAM-dependent methyltransferase
MEKLKIFEGDHNIAFEDFVNGAFNKGGVMVDIGCGKNKIHPSFIGIDPYVEDNEEEILIKANMWETPFEDDSVDLIVCFSALEHISKYFVIPTLKEFSRILKSGGAFAIVVPNLYYIFKAFVENPNNGWEMDMIFGHQGTEGEYHKTGFTVDIIKWYFDYVPKLKILNIYDVNAYSQFNYGIIGKKL